MDTQRLQEYFVFGLEKETDSWLEKHMTPMSTIGCQSTGMVLACTMHGGKQHLAAQYIKLRMVLTDV